MRLHKVLLRASVALVLVLCLTGQVSHGQAVCSSVQFMCASRKCIPKSWACDGEDDCGDNSDEDPSKCPGDRVKCSENEFRCKNGRCIIDNWLCDGTDDCRDNSDEDPLICRPRTCRSDQFACRNTTGECVPTTWLCDGDPDCTDGSDEADCNVTCTPEQFHCQADDRCISKQWVCDRDPDCTDGADEQDCDYSKRCNKETQFVCGSGECIDNSSRCDGDRDCQDGSDEDAQLCMPPDHAGGAGAGQEACPAGEVPCGDDRLTCIHHGWVCDGDVDCPNGFDEDPEKCAPPPCREDQFRCGGLGECIAHALVCDNKRDCRDGSDEANCNISTGNSSVHVPTARRPCDPEHEFRCASGLCLPASVACNGADDCGDGSDEHERCEQNECSLNNGGCSHGCQNLPSGYRCFCPLGFRLQADNRTCEDIDECQIPGSCSQTCINLKGSYKCECLEGYQRDPTHPHFCKAIEVHASLLLTHRTDIRKIGLYQRELSSIVNNTRSASAVDYHFRTGMVFWADLVDRKIYKSPIDEGLRRTVVVSDVTAEGIAVDWLYQHLYWISAGKEDNRIEVADLGGRYRTTVVRTGLLQPRSITLDPASGWMYWSDWGSQPRIERAGMDGSLRETIIDTRVEWPNGLTLDLVRRRLYWVDAKLKLIESADLDGGHRQIVVSSPQVLRHPFSIATFEDSIFWTDWDLMNVFKANKFTGEGVTSVATAGQLHFPVAVRVYHPYLQPNSTNHCQPINGRCSHVCLPRPAVDGSTGGRTGCACPPGLRLLPDGLTCTDTDLHAPVSLPPTRESGGSAGPNVISTLPGEQDRDAGAAPPVEQDGVTSTTTTTSVPPERSGRGPVGVPDGAIAGIVIGSILFVLIILLFVALFLYRQYFVRGFRGLHLENPVYKKTTMDGLRLEKSRSPGLPSRGTEDSLAPLNP